VADHRVRGPLPGRALPTEHAPVVDALASDDLLIEVQAIAAI
jgi:hypothetical protein